MQLGVGKTMFPSWAAAITLVHEHGGSAVDHATAAVRAGDGGTRLDHAVRAMTSFDHAIDNTGKLPVQWFVPRASVYLRGYETAKQAVTLLVASGLVPGARERVGRQSLLAAKDTFLAGVQASSTERGRYGRHLASGWLEATAEDAVTGVAMLKSGDLGRSLLSGVNQVRVAVARGNRVDERLVQSVSGMFDRAAGELQALEQGAARQPSSKVDDAAFARAGELMAQVEADARVLVADVVAAQAKLPVAG
jgi:hypothetical protein